MKFCIRCGADLLDEQARFCPECGAAVPVKSSAATPDDSAHAPLSTAEPSPPLVDPATHLAPRSSRKRIPGHRLLWAGLGLVIVAAIAVGVYFGVRSNDFPSTSRDDGPGLFPVVVDEEYGYVGRGGELIIAPQFSIAHPFYEELAPVSFDDGETWGYVDTRGQVVIQPRFAYAGRFAEGSALVQMEEDGPYGYVDSAGELAIPARFDEGIFYYLAFFSDGLAPASLDGQTWGYIDTLGEFVIQPRFSLAHPFSDGFAAVQEPGAGAYFIDKFGRRVFESQAYRAGSDFSEGLAAASVLEGDSFEFGFIDTTGAWVIEPRFSWVAGFSEGLAMVALDGFPGDEEFVYGFIDNAGTVVIEPQFKMPAEMWRIRPVYDPLQHVCAFSDGRAIASFDGETFGYIDTTGKMVVEPQFTGVSPFHDGLALVRRDGDAGPWGYIDAVGEVVWWSE